jgi:hypothetical protein
MRTEAYTITAIDPAGTVVREQRQHWDDHQSTVADLRNRGYLTRSVVTVTYRLGPWFTFTRKGVVLAEPISNSREREARRWRRRTLTWTPARRQSRRE